MVEHASSAVDGGAKRIPFEIEAQFDKRARRMALYRSIIDARHQERLCGWNPDGLRVSHDAYELIFSDALLYGPTGQKLQFAGLLVMFDSTLAAPFEVFARFRVPGRKIEEMKAARRGRPYRAKRSLRERLNA